MSSECDTYRQIIIYFEVYMMLVSLHGTTTFAASAFTANKSSSNKQIISEISRRRVRRKIAVNEIFGNISLNSLFSYKLHRPLALRKKVIHKCEYHYF